jgi:hypothetical protein
MKARWASGSLRLRITPTELESLIRGEAIQESLGLVGSWNIRIEPNGETRLVAHRERVTVKLSPKDIQQLAQPASEGVYFTSTEIPTVAYFIEKDFPCVHPRPPETRDPETETFEPPLGFKNRPRPR